MGEYRPMRTARLRSTRDCSSAVRCGSPYLLALHRHCPADVLSASADSNNSDTGSDIPLRMSHHASAPRSSETQRMEKILTGFESRFDAEKARLAQAQEIKARKQEAFERADAAFRQKKVLNSGYRLNAATITTKFRHIIKPDVSVAAGDAC